MEVLYFLTGESKSYNPRTGVFQRVFPFENFFFVPAEKGKLLGRGGWQIAARYSWLDLVDKGVAGANLNDMTLGLNWFLNPNMKVQWNYSLVYRDVPSGGSDGIIQAFGTRLAWDF